MRYTIETVADKQILTGVRSQAIHAPGGREHVVLVHIYLSLLPERRVGD
jgi:hypothetical protein